MQETRAFFAQTLYRVATPFREVSWADFLLADILTSLAKALSDSERALCHLLAGPVMQPHTSDMVCACVLKREPLWSQLPEALLCSAGSLLVHSQGRIRRLGFCDVLAWLPLPVICKSSCL
jgi:hypothetical protein